MNPILFLDFDGVIRVSSNQGWVTSKDIQFSQERMDMIADILEKVDAKVVVSSDWRDQGNKEEIKSLLSPRLSNLLHEDWMTPIKGKRWIEILQWLKEHPEIKTYAILDDFISHFNGCPDDMGKRIILCSNRYGFVTSMNERLANTLKNEYYDKQT